MDIKCTACASCANGCKCNKEPRYSMNLEEATLHISKGNSKLGTGIYTFSTLPGDENHLLIVEKDGTLLTNIPGTCSRHCDSCFDNGCYAVNSAKLHHNVNIKAWGENTLLLRAGKAFSMIDAFITKKNAKYTETKDPADIRVKTFRINVSGEIESLEQFEGWNDIAVKHPEVMFGLYTKNYEDLEKFLEIHGDTADNFVVNISQWHGVADEFLAKHPGKFNVFEYDNSNRPNNDFSDEDLERLGKLVHCPAVLKTGHRTTVTCDHCGRCYRKTGQTTAVWDH